MSTQHHRLAELAQAGQRQFTSIAHLLTPQALEEAFRGLRKDASAGVDGVTYAEYQANAPERIAALHDRLQSGRYRAQPLRRTYIPKDSGEPRPISIPMPVSYCTSVPVTLGMGDRGQPAADPCGV